MTFLPSMWFKPFYILRVALEPEIQLMQYLTDSVSIRNKTEEMLRQHREGQRHHNICSLHSLVPMQAVLQLGVENIYDETCRAQVRNLASVLKAFVGHSSVTMHPLSGMAVEAFQFGARSVSGKRTKLVE